MTTDKKRIYLDNAATSWPKPESVYTAVDHYLRAVGASAGRSVYREAVEADRALQRTRAALAQLIGAADPRHVIFTSNGTDSLNLALHGTLQPGDHVVTSVAEHNSVLRPLRELQETHHVRVTRVPVDSSGTVDPGDIRRALRPNTRMVALIHASNVTGALQPAAEVGDLAREAGLLFLLDAAQSLGQVPIDVAALNVDLLAAPGHKGLLGPLGTGLLYIAPGTEAVVRSIRQGGTGTQSELDLQPSTLPDKYESGNHNVPGLVGLGAGIEFVATQGVTAIRRHELQLVDRLMGALRGESKVTLYGPDDVSRRVGLVSLTVEGYDPQELASMLDAAHRIQVRAGLHCAPAMHQALGTLKTGGTLRVSIGPFNTSQQIDLVAQSIQQAAGC